MDIRETLVFRPSKPKLIGKLVGASAFVAIGILLVRTAPWFAWATIVLFGLSVVVLALELLPNSDYVRVGPEGFTVRGLFRAYSYRWRDVDAFGVQRVGGTKRVVFSFSNEYRNPRRLARAYRLLAGADAVVAEAGALDVSMHDLVEVLNRYREYYRAV